eukprot:CAMPEP_0115232168 /NCGR_PEP_ID=MMETSP0270-20121206/33624_1 /TAXON_ID=71861 /ORGANISM="Scrippsiella trochoidea, Strain CCMP3099" /LENGTH=48 /DNA_ID= /DNA_START= /DNA_END= /DNA_ORIENTATION=
MQGPFTLILSSKRALHARALHAFGHQLRKGWTSVLVQSQNKVEPGLGG